MTTRLKYCRSSEERRECKLIFLSLSLSLLLKPIFYFRPNADGKKSLFQISNPVIASHRCIHSILFHHRKTDIAKILIYRRTMAKYEKTFGPIDETAMYMYIYVKSANVYFRMTPMSSADRFQICITHDYERYRTYVQLPRDTIARAIDIRTYNNCLRCVFPAPVHFYSRSIRQINRRGCGVGVQRESRGPIISRFSRVITLSAANSPDALLFSRRRSSYRV